MMGRSIRRLLAACAGVALLAASQPTSFAQATLPSVYVLGSGAQGMTLLFNFSGSTINPLVNGAVPYAITSMSSNASPQGVSSLAYPGTLGLIYQDSVELALSSSPELQPAGREVGYVLPKYPIIARADGRERRSDVGAPVLTNSDGAMRLASGRQACRVADDDSSVGCEAFLTDVVVPMSQALAPPGEAPGSAAARVAAFRAWRDGLTRSLQPLQGLRPLRRPAQQTGEEKTLASVASIKSTSRTTVAEEPARAESTVVLKGVDLLGGLLHMDAVVQRYTATSDGEKGAAKAVTTISGAVLGGVPVTIGAGGVQIAETQALGGDQVAQANQQLQEALATAGLRLVVAQHKDASSGGDGAVAGDAFTLQAHISNGPTTYTLQGWLASGRVQAMRSLDPKPLGEPDQETVSGGSTSGADGTPQLVGGSGPANGLASGSPALALDEGGLGSGLSSDYAKASSPSRSSDGPPAGLGGTGSEAATMETAAGSVGLGSALATPAAAVGRRAGGPSRTTVLGLFAIWQMLGLAALAAWGLKVTQAAKAG